MHVSVVIITRNRHSLLTKALDSIEHQSVRLDEVVIIGGSDIPYRISTKQDQQITFRYIPDTGRSIPCARNIGVEQSKGDIVFFVDDDCILDADAIKEVHKQFRHSPRTQAVVGRTRNGAPDNMYASVQRYYYERWLRSFGLTFNVVQRLPDGCLMDFEILAAKKSLLQKYPFNPELPFGRDEDVEIGVRIHRDTQDIYFNPFIEADHIPRHTLLSLIYRNYVVGYCDASVNRIAEKENINMSHITYIVYIILRAIYPFFSRVGRCAFLVQERLQKI